MPLVPITDRFFKPNDYVGLRFQRGTVFVRIDSVEILEYSPYNVADEANTAITLDEQEASSTEITPRDPRAAAKEILGGGDLLGTPPGYEEGMGQFLHGAVGVFPNNMRVYIRAPAKGSGRLAGEFPGLAAPNIGGDSLAKMDGSDSPYSQPTNFREIVLVPGMSWSISYFNNEPTSLTGQAYDEEQPILKLLFARYACEILRPSLDPAQTNFADDFAQEKARRDNRLIRGLVSGRIPNSPNVRFEYLTVGTGFAPVAFGGNVKDWKVSPIPDRVALLLEEF
jgi:hypothetical protein